MRFLTLAAAAALVAITSTAWAATGPAPKADVAASAALDFRCTTASVANTKQANTPPIQTAGRRLP